MFRIVIFVISAVLAVLGTIFIVCACKMGRKSSNSDEGSFEQKINEQAQENSKELLPN